jgi:glycosyltransferase involved in cell wall biosynthesis
MPPLKRVLIYRNELLPASETFIAAQAGAMRKYDVRFVGLQRVANGIELDEARVMAATTTDSLRDKLLRRIYMTMGGTPSFHRKLRKLVPALIHAHFAVDGCMALPLQKKLRAPLIVTLHGYDVTRSDESLGMTSAGKIYVARRHELWKRTNLFVCVSEHIRRSALQRGFPEQKLWVHRIGIDQRNSALPALNKRDPIVLFVGRLVEKKGCIHLIHAMAQVKTKLADTRLVVIGDGPLRTELEDESRKRLPGALFLGTQTAAMVRSWMRRSQMLAVPSVVAKNGDSEGLPIVLCEAQAMGLPVVAFRGPGVTEAVIDGETALLVEPRDDEALGAAILRLSQDALLQARLGEAGRRHVERYFDLRRQTEILEDKYDEVLGGQ